VAVNLVLIAALGLGMMLLVPSVLGYHHYVILTGSMTGTYDAGSIVYDKAVPTDGLKVGDVITYTPPPGFSSHDLVTHRIYKIGRGRDGVRTYKTKGDANKAVDAWEFNLTKPAQDQVKFHVPYVGYLLEILSIRQFRMFLIGIPALLVALTVLRGLWRDAREEVLAAQRPAGWGEFEAIHDPESEPLAALGGRASPVIVALPPSVWSAAAPERKSQRPTGETARGPQVIQLHDLHLN
jgi:signal peptidase